MPLQPHSGVCSSSSPGLPEQRGAALLLKACPNGTMVKKYEGERVGHGWGLPQTAKAFMVATLSEDLRVQVLEKTIWLRTRSELILGQSVATGGPFPVSKKKYKQTKIQQNPQRNPTSQNQILTRPLARFLKRWPTCIYGLQASQPETEEAPPFVLCFTVSSNNLFSSSDFQPMFIVFPLS